MIQASDLLDVHNVYELILRLAVLALVGFVAWVLTR